MKISYFGKAVRSIFFAAKPAAPAATSPPESGNTCAPACRKFCRTRRDTSAVTEQNEVQRLPSCSGALTENQAVKTKIHKCLLCICRLTVCKRGKNQQSSSNRVHCSSVRRSRPIPCGKVKTFGRRLYGARWWVACYNYPHREVK